MTDTVFVNAVTLTDAGWFNDVNNLRYGNNSAARGSDLLQFIQSGTGASTRTAQDKLRESVSITDFGAVGDGVTDDTAAIQAAINSIPLSAGGTAHGYELYFPPGKYLVSDTLVIGNRRLTLHGSGGYMMGSGSATIIAMTDANKDILDFYTGNSDVLSVSGIQFQGAGKGTGTGNAIRGGSSGQTWFDSVIKNCWFTLIPNACIYADYAADLTVENCGLENAKYGVYVAHVGIAGGDINKLVTNTFYGLDYGIYVVAGEDLLISGNQMAFCGVNPGGVMDNTSGAIVLINGAAPSLRSTLIDGNMFRANVTDIIVDGSTGSAIGTNTGVLETSILNNQSDRCYRRFTLIDDADNTRVVGNTISCPNGEAGAFDAIEVVGTADGTYINKNSVSAVAGATPRYGLSLGTNTVNTILGENSLTGSSGAISLGAAATFQVNQQMKGTWTPAFVGAGTAGTNTYTTQNGKWTTWGDMVWASCQIVMSVKDGAMAGGISIPNIPFPVLSGDDPVSGAIGGFSRINLGADEHLSVRTNASALVLIASNDAGALSQIDAADLTATCEFECTIVYRRSGAAINSGTTVL